MKLQLDLSQDHTVEQCQQRHFIGSGCVSHSAEIWDRYRAWLESWIPKRPCTSGGIFLSNPVVCLQPATLSSCSLCQSAFVYISWTDHCLSQDNHQLHKESHGGNSGLHNGCVQHFKPYSLGFDCMLGYVAPYTVVKPILILCLKCLVVLIFLRN